MPLQDRQDILLLLDAMRRGADTSLRLAAARKLLAHLNYEPANQLLRVQLDPVTAKQLIVPPTVVASAADRAFLVIHVQLASDNLLRALERATVTALLKDHPYALFIFSNRDNTRWHLLNVKIARKEASDENRDVKIRRLFRRISISAEDRLRTAVERIEKLDLAAIHPELFGISPLAVQEAHDDAFDVEAVTKQFFQTYSKVFKTVESTITGIKSDDTRRLFTQRLFNRLMFIAFIQKKGWLKFLGMEDNQYLDALWHDYRSKKKDKSNFYADRLEYLFFQALNSPVEVNIPAKLAQRAKVTSAIGDVPYLNGGLFEKSDDGTDDDEPIVIPDQAIHAILHDLFAAFNFTVTESTPLDIEVAVDPEMLGKVFEELVTDRHGTGSYYTPKPIVSFMCREALKGYISTKRPKESPAAIALFIDDHDASKLSDGEAILESLRDIKCCDPACGSGAYLLGMMHELLDLRASLFASDKKLDPVTTYQRKLEIIQTNVYGVDIDPFAVNIACLRLWLSLAVDFQGDAPPPLPNLDFKIESGDSLAAPDPSGGFDPGFQAAMVDEFLDLKRQFLMSHSTAKKELKKKIDTLRKKIMSWTGFTPDPGIFHWQVEFAEVFVKGGFDAILANPPYVRQELIKDQKPRLKEVYGSLFSGTADLYIFFYLRGLQLLRPGGMLVFISSNKWFRAGYGEKLRAHIAKTTTVETILDFHDLPVFEAIAYPMIFSAAKRTPAQNHQAILAEPPDLEPPYPDVASVVAKYGYRMPPTAVGKDGTWQLTSSSTADRLAKMYAAGPTLRELSKTRVYRGLTTGLNEAFVIHRDTRDALLAKDKNAHEIIKPYAGGRDLNRWFIDDVTRWIIVTKIGTDMRRYPAVMSHLKKYNDGLEARDDQGDHWWELRACAYYDEFEKPKILSTKVSIRPTFSLDTRRRYLGNTSYFFPIDKALALFVLAVLNSSASAFFAQNTFVGKQSGWYEVQPTQLEGMPIPHASPADRAAIAALAQKCLDAHGVNCEQWEKEIDERVAALYGL